MDKDSREKLIEAATAQFAEKGYNGVSIREVAKVAGVNSSLISYYFGGKEGLYTAMLEQHFAMIAGAASRMRSGGLSPRERLEAYAQAVLAIHRKAPFLIRFFYSEMLSPTPAFGTIVQNNISQVFAALTAAIEEGIATGQFRAGLDPRLAALSLVGTLNFYFMGRPIISRIVTNHAEEAERYVQQAVSLYFEGLMRREEDE